MTHLLHPVLCTLWEQEAEPGIAGDVEHGLEKKLTLPGVGGGVDKLTLFRVQG